MVKKTRVTDNVVDPLVTEGLKSIDDNMLLANRKETDEGLNGLIKDYREISDKRSNYEDVEEDISGAELKQLVNRLEFRDRLKVVYRYMVATGNIDDVEEYGRKVNNLKLSLFKWFGFACLILFVMTIGGVVTMGIMTNDIDSNGVISSFMSIVRRILDMAIGSKPTIE